MSAKVINLFGGPGSGKSTTAAGLFWLMKTAGLCCEYVPELCKWEAYTPETFPDQSTIFQQQARLMDQVAPHVDWIVTDCPLKMCLAYATSWGDREDIYREAALYANYNVFLQRATAFAPWGRLQGEAEAKGLDETIRKLCGPFEMELPGNEWAPEGVFVGIVRAEMGPVLS